MDAVKVGRPPLVGLAMLIILQESVHGLILNPNYAEYLAILKAARNGAVYGAKIRAPHALV